MHSDDDSAGGTPARVGHTVGFGRLAYDPLTRTYWYYGLGLASDQGGTYVGPTNFGTKSLEDLCNILKYQVTQIAEDLHNRAMERVNDKEG